MRAPLVAIFAKKTPDSLQYSNKNYHVMRFIGNSTTHRNNEKKLEKRGRDSVCRMGLELLRSVRLPYVHKRFFWSE